MLNERQTKLLKVIVEDYIKTARPVSSKAICNVLNCSSATIRNEMSFLEENGLLEKTHISSGRVPSENGYRYYLIKIDSLKRNITKYGKGTWENGDIFAIRRTVAISGENVTLGADCEVCYKPKTSESTEIVNIGKLDINHPVK